MKVVVKRLDELTTSELYKILKARAEIFIVEQKINCQDMDDIDYKSVHCFIQEGNKVIAYLRAFYKSEDKSVVKTLSNKFFEVGNGYGCAFAVKFNDHAVATLHFNLYVICFLV